VIVIALCACDGQLTLNKLLGCVLPVGLFLTPFSNQKLHPSASLWTRLKTTKSGLS
jgi:hypothetical protein